MFWAKNIITSFGQASNEKVFLFQSDGSWPCFISTSVKPLAVSGKLDLYQRRCWYALKANVALNCSATDYSALYGSNKGTAHWLPFKNEESLACRGLSSFLFDVEIFPNTEPKRKFSLTLACLITSISSRSNHQKTRRHTEPQVFYFLKIFFSSKMLQSHLSNSFKLYLLYDSKTFQHISTLLCKSADYKSAMLHTH